jgi:hypothetical protein
MAMIDYGQSTTVDSKIPVLLIPSVNIPVTVDGNDESGIHRFEIL